MTTNMTMIERSAAYIDGSMSIDRRGLMRATDNAPEELTNGIALVESFSNVVAFDSDEGLTLFDVSHVMSAATVVAALRKWSSSPVHTAVYTHGHIDHVTGARTFQAEAASKGHSPIRFLGHEAIPARFDRYHLTNGYNGHINMRQFRLPEPFFADDFIYPDETFRTETTFKLGGRTFELHHARGETDDHSWAWVPEDRALCVGDFFIWQFPNAGNPQKVQRYAWEWAVALRAMAAKGAELLLPAHGPAISGRERIAMVLNDTAEALESLIEQTLSLMNTGARLDDVIHGVQLPEHLANKPYLSATYDEPEFVVRNIWRLYGGWYDGNPANLKPAREADLAREMSSLAGGATVLAHRAQELANAGDFRLACHLIEMAHIAEPTSGDIRGIRAEIYKARVKSETSLMATGIYRAAHLDSSPPTP